MNKRRYGRLLVAVTAVLLLFTGCSLDVEQYLRPPAIQGEQQAIQAALETYIHDSGQSGSRYSLRYPVEGEHTAAFVLCDASGRDVGEDMDEAALAVAFYSVASAPNDTHINLMRREEQGWVSVADIIGASADILQVAFGDLDGDGVAELIAGWDTYNSREHRLSVFSLVNGLKRLGEDRLYNRLFVGDLTATGKDSLLLLRMANAEVSASLETVKDGALMSLGQVWLDKDIQQFTGMALCRLASGVHGLFVDAVKGTDTAVTELIYVDESGLHAPFCHQTTRINTVTARPAGFAMRDVDGDARVDIPLCTLLDGYTVGTETMADYAYETDWMTWDYATGEWSVGMRTVVNAADGYFVVIDRLTNVLTTTYDPAERELTLLDAEREQPLMRLRPIESGLTDYVVVFDATEQYAGCAVWYDKELLDIDRVRYAVSRLEA